MRPAVLLAWAALLPGGAMGQGVPTINTPGRGIVAQPMPPAGPQLQPGQFLPAVPPPPGSGGAAPLPTITPAPPAAAPMAPVLAGDWVAQGTAELRGIDKVMARTVVLSAKVGEAVRFGPLTVVVRNCVVRPADRAPDAAGFLEVSEGGKPPLFRGWMIVSAPQLAVVEHATHDIRLAACRP